MTGSRRLCYPKSVRRHRAAFDHGYRSAVLARRGDEHFPREDAGKSTVFDLVYKYLEKCADKDRKLKQRNCACNKFNKQHARRRDIRGRDVATIRMDRNVLSKRTSRSSSKECVADYRRAVRDGRRRAKVYVREALLYGLQSGLLIPTDRRRNVLRVSRELGTFPSRNAREDDEDLSSIVTSDTEYPVRNRRT